MIGSGLMNNKSASTDGDDNFPELVQRTCLWKQLSSRREYVSVLVSIRDTAAALANQISSTLPGYTDHSVKHMDSLWGVCQQVMTEDESAVLSQSEAFILAASFYVHDLGMAAPVTNEGAEEIRKTPEYDSAFARFKRFYAGDLARAEQAAISDATRELHAKKSRELATGQLPGLKRFLIEDSGFRDRWAHILGQIAESHHWTLEEVERSLGSRKAMPSPDGDTIDLAYVACLLRIIDYAHISRARAPKVDRALRREVPADSALHWDAQANITGPSRDGDFLVFGSTRPTDSTDAWWLFFDMVTGLDAEIRAVYEYLRGRTVSATRFSLKGVKGVENPTTFGRYVTLPEGVVPIDIRVQPESMERVVELLGGKHIYGRDEIAPVRELIQNARDAIELRNALERAGNVLQTPGKICVGLQLGPEGAILWVRDNGIGMTRSVVQKHLVGVGSDFWNSLDFTRDYRKAIDFGFRPIGKFGIGFLSIFMLGDVVEVETEAAGNNRLKLTLQGVGRRGELREEAPTGVIGTEVRISLTHAATELLSDLTSIVRARAPMLSVPIIVEIMRDTRTIETIAPEWWKTISEDQFFLFVREWENIAHRGTTKRKKDEEMLYREAHYFYGGYDYRPVVVGKGSLSGWPGEKPQYISDAERSFSSGGESYLGIIRCSQGIAVDRVQVADITAIVDLGEMDLTVSREALAESRGARGPRPRVDGELANRLTLNLRPAVVSQLNDLGRYGMLPGRTNFLRAMALIFGDSLLDETTLAWIPVTEPPGNLVHRSREYFIDFMKGQDRILIAIGETPAGAYAIASPHVSALQKMIVVAIRKEEVQADYSLRDKLDREGLTGRLKGTLDYILTVVSGSRSDIVLTRFLLKCVAEAWGASDQMLAGQNWQFEYKADTLWAELSRIGVSTT